MNTSLLTLIVCSSLAVGCVTDGASAPVGVTPGTPVPATTGVYLGTYRVPTSPDLAEAATYPVGHVHWTVANGIATLHYELPLGLVGGKLSVTLAGVYEAGATTVTLAGEQGTGACVAQADVITCREEFANLGILPISMAVVEQIAALEYAGPVTNRIELANLFGSDPIGIVDFDLRSPVIDDNGGGGGGNDDL